MENKIKIIYRERLGEHSTHYEVELDNDIKRNPEEHMYALINTVFKITEEDREYKRKQSMELEMKQPNE